jgi:SET domain-containing protein
LYSLDATNSLQHGRYANDAAPGDAQQNAIMKCVSNKGRPHLALFAMRTIAAEEEIRYDYGVPNLPWRKKVIFKIVFTHTHV